MAANSDGVPFIGTSPDGCPDDNLRRIIDRSNFLVRSLNALQHQKRAANTLYAALLEPGQTILEEFGFYRVLDINDPGVGLYQRICDFNDRVIDGHHGDWIITYILEKGGLSSRGF